MNYIKDIKAALRISTPIFVVKTADPGYFIKSINVAIGEKTPLLEWRVTTGIVAINELGGSAAEEINRDPSGADPAVVTGNYNEALQRALKFMPNNTCLFMTNINFPLEVQDELQRMVAIQSVWDCRDAFKATGRAVFLLCQDMTIPPALSGDVMVIDIPLPTKDEIVEIVKGIAVAGRIPEPDAATLDKASSALLGLAPYAVDQSAALSLTPKGFNISKMWDLKVSDINRTPGLRVERGESSFDNLLGLDSIVEFGKALLDGEDAPSVIVLVDELEKQIAGSGSDSSGVSQDQMAQVLTCMEEYQWDGMLLYGMGGSGKTEFSKCLGSQAGLFMWLDLGGMKGRYVGQSEQQVRMAMKKLYAIGGSRVFVVGTCNGVATIPAPLYRRLSAGTYFFDFPEPKAQAAMWKHYMTVNNIPEQPLPPHENWTGAEIKKCCMWARRLKWTLVQASRRITPVFKAMGDDVKTLRAQASGKYLSPSHDGYYASKQPLTVQDVKRSISSN